MEECPYCGEKHSSGTLPSHIKACYSNPKNIPVKEPEPEKTDKKKKK